MLKYAVFSGVGDRTVNEDAVAAVEKDDHFCFVVCDGLGGHGMGDVASCFVADIFAAQFKNTQLTEAYLPSTFSLAQELLLAKQAQNGVKNKMKTTVAALAVSNDRAFIGHIGDSRVYVFLKDKRKLRTIDHSVPQMLALAGEIKDEEIRGHPDRNIILRAMGTEWDRPMFELMQPIELSECRAFLLCSDGFWEYISEDEMLLLLKNSKTVEEWINAMSSLVEQNGANAKMDNYSAIAIFNSDYPVDNSPA